MSHDPRCVNESFHNIPEGCVFDDPNAPLPGWEQQATWQSKDGWARYGGRQTLFACPDGGWAALGGMLASGDKYGSAPTLRAAMQAAEDAARASDQCVICLSRAHPDISYAEYEKAAGREIAKNLVAVPEFIFREVPLSTHSHDGPNCGNALCKNLRKPIIIRESVDAGWSSPNAYCLACGGTTSAHRILCPMETPRVEEHAQARTDCCGARDTGDMRGHYDSCGMRRLFDSYDGPPRTLPAAQDAWNAPVALLWASVCRKCGQSACMHPRELD